MKKIISSCLILILIGLFIANWYCSRKTEQTYRAQISRLNDDYAGTLQLGLDSYKAGLFLSSARVQVDLLQGGQMVLQQQIRHFPWGVRILTTLAADSDLGEKVALSLPLEQIQLQSDIDLSGQSRSHLDLPELTISDADNSLRLSGFLLKCNLDHRESSGELSLDLDEFTISQGGESNLSLSGLSSHSRFNSPEGIPLGEAEVQLEAFRSQVPGHPPLKFNGLLYRVSSRRAGEEILSSGELSVDALDLMEESFQQLDLQVQLGGLKAASLLEFRENLNHLRTDFLNQQVDPLILQVQLLGMYSQLLDGGLMLKLERLELHHDQGRLRAQGNLELSERQADVAQLRPDRVSAQLSLQIDQELFAAGVRVIDRLKHQGQLSDRAAVINEQAEQLAGALVQRGLLSREEAGYRLELKLDAGKGRLNEQPLAL